MTWSFWVNLAAKIVGAILSLVTPEIKQLLADLLNNLYKKAVATPNPWDDKLVELLAEIVGVNLEPPK
jgi:hypothetical protein